MTNGDGILAGKTVVVTGGGRGIGKMITTGLVEVGANVHICGRKQAELEALAEELSPIGKVTTFVADLANPDDIYPFAEHVGEQGPHLHALVNNAGANWGAPVDTFPAAAWDRVLNVNLRGLFVLTQALLPLLRAASTSDNPSRIVNVGSVDGIRAPAPGFDNFSYAASKAGVHMLTQQLAANLAPDILVNAVAPGLFPSKMTAGLLQDGEAAAASSIPLQRVGAPVDISALVTFLLGPTSTYITGAIIPIDGGVSLTR